MKETVPLRVCAVSNLPDTHIAINPNDGFDLGLMTTCYDVNMYQASIERIEKEAQEVFEGRIHLKNECANNTVEMHKSLFLKLQTPSHVCLVYENGRLGLRPVKETP